ncbi:MAG TPA: AAA family ATPase [Nitrosopumilaceae archaeon]|jgi:hypothetical protein|nr:AAA family ATPase [Nitrosopumilaceae archaeon]
MPTMEDVDPSILYCLFKGEPGTRKSTEALSFPLPQYWASIDKKMESINIPMRKWGISKKDVEFDDYNDYNSLRAKLESFQPSGRCILRDNRKIATLVIDSVTSLGDVIGLQTRNAKGGTRKSGEDAGRQVAGIKINEYEDYNAEASAFQELQSILKDIHKYHKVNVILIAHVIQTQQKSPDGKTHFARSIVTGGKIAAAKIPVYASEIYHFNMKMSLNADSGGQYGLLTTHTGDDFARTALPLPSEIMFGDDRLYDKFLVPAIKAMKGDISI